MLDQRERVQITDAFGTHVGIVTMTWPDNGMCAVKWDDSGITERIHESELTVLQPELTFSERLKKKLLRR